MQNIYSALTTYECEADGHALQPYAFTYQIAQNFGGENFGKVNIIHGFANTV